MSGRSSEAIAAVQACAMPVAVIERVTEPARRQNTAKRRQQGNDSRHPPTQTLIASLVATSGAGCYHLQG